MTAVDLGKCAVCNEVDAIGIACTSIPCSVPYCTGCAAVGADPVFVFEYWLNEFGTRFDDMNNADKAKTYKDGKYITYREWATEREGSNESGVA